VSYLEQRRREYGELDRLAEEIEEVPHWTDAAQVMLDQAVAIAKSSSKRWPMLRRGARDEIPALTRRLVLRRDNHHCKRCAEDTSLQLDHVVPWSHFGPDRSDNLQTLCEWCNSQRSNFLELGQPQRIIGVTVVCDPCLCEHDGNMGRKHDRENLWFYCPLCRDWGAEWEGNDRVPAYCGTCDLTSWVSDAGRIL